MSFCLVSFSLVKLSVFISILFAVISFNLVGSSSLIDIESTDYDLDSASQNTLDAGKTIESAIRNGRAGHIFVLANVDMFSQLDDVEAFKLAAHLGHVESLRTILEEKKQAVSF